MAGVFAGASWGIAGQGWGEDQVRHAAGTPGTGSQGEFRRPRQADGPVGVRGKVKLLKIFFVLEFICVVCAY